MSHDTRYEIILYWSEEDQAVIAEVPELPGCAADGATYQEALAIARHQHAKWWERRAAMSLSQLWQQQGERAKAYEHPAPIYSCCTEGFDTADLQEAKALLDELAG